MQLKPGKHDKGCVVSNNALSRSPFAKGEEFFVEDSEPQKTALKRFISQP